MQVPTQKNYLLAIVSIITFFLVLEGLSRIGITIFRDTFADTSDEWFIYSPDLEWELKPNFRGQIHHSYPSVEREFDSRGFISVDTPQISNTDKPKIIFIGDSNTFGWGVPTKSTFVEVLDSLLPDISAINLGVPGYTSYQGYQLLKKRGLELNPDVIVVSFNFNDRRSVLNNYQIDNRSLFQKKYEQYEKAKFMRYLREMFLERLYLYRDERFLFRKLGIIKEGKVKKIRVDTLVPRVDPENYRKNLKSIVELAKSKNIYVIFIILKDNPIQSEYLKKGIEFLYNSQYDSAMENLNIAVLKNNWFSDLARIYLARAYKEHGQIKESENVLSVKRPEKEDDFPDGGYPIYLDTEYNEIMREVAAEYNVETLDAGRFIDENPSDYIDFCHIDEEGHRKIAYLLYESLSNKMPRKKVLSNLNESP